MANAIMIQGTASNAGKSLLAAGLCRIFAQDGYKVAPFKSQNMALNSAITPDGFEMGRAQVVQAEAAGVAPDVRMNPILLKPTSHVGSQVIVNGVPRGTMPAGEYFRYRKSLIPEVMAAYESLAAEYDIIVIEGAGSPAEINLRQDDIVNMGMARRANAPVLLCGDIDRGGVFASLYGTVKLLEPDEQARIKGLIINKFRGDVDILRPGLGELERLSGKPVLGVVPMLDVDVDDEDSLSHRLSGGGRVGLVDIAVVRLPRLSNFTDFNPLERMEEVTLRYVRNPRELGHPDLVLLPGTKNTMDDLRWLRESGMEAAVLKHASAGGAVIGICGGYQMLGNTVSDPDGVEGGGSLRGLGLLPADTVFLRDAAFGDRLRGGDVWLQAYFLRGVSQSLIRQYTSSIANYTAAIDRNPSNPFLYINRSTTQSEMIDFISSIDNGYQRIAVDSDPSSRLKTRSDRVYDYDEAIADLNKAAKLLPDFAYIYYNRGNLLCLSGRMPEAIEDYTRAIELNPSFGEAYYNRGLIQIYLKDTRKGCLDMSKAGELGVADAYKVLRIYGQPPGRTQ